MTFNDIVANIEEATGIIEVKYTLERNFLTFNGVLEFATWLHKQAIFHCAMPTPRKTCAASGRRRML